MATRAAVRSPDSSEHSPFGRGEIGQGRGHTAQTTGTDQGDRRKHHQRRVSRHSHPADAATFAEVAEAVALRVLALGQVDDDRNRESEQERK